MQILCLAIADSNTPTSLLYFINQITNKLATTIEKKFIAYQELNDIYPCNSLKILNPKIWKYKGTIYKLRVDCGKESARILFMRDKNKDIVILHAFLKKTQKTPKKEADIAMRNFTAACNGAPLQALFKR
ncbi:MAG: type II toxin-antitoxin system RelE/ParE family toxin [Shewanella sp.]